MARNVFYSFHYEPDNWRAAQIRNIGAIFGNQPAKDNDWETIKRGGDTAIKKWIDDQLYGRSCTVVLIGAETAGRKWVTHEIIESWNKGMGVVGVRIHSLKDRYGRQSSSGSNPFDYVNHTKTGRKLSSIVETHDPFGFDSQWVYSEIANNLESWIANAVRIRQQYT